MKTAQKRKCQKTEGEKNIFSWEKGKKFLAFPGGILYSSSIWYKGDSLPIFREGFLFIELVETGFGPLPINN